MNENFKYFKIQDDWVSFYEKIQEGWLNILLQFKREVYGGGVFVVEYTGNLRNYNWSENICFTNTIQDYHFYVLLSPYFFSFPKGKATFIKIKFENWR